jgi:alpha-glucuronidase
MSAKTHSVTVHGAIGTGKNVTEAKADAARAIATAFSEDGNYSPLLIRFPLGEVGLVYRTLQGWEYTYLRPDQDQGSHYCVMGHVSKRETEARLRRHMAQLYIFATPNNGLSLLAPWDEEGRKTHLGYVAWQVRMREAMAAGMTSDEARASIG